MTAAVLLAAGGGSRFTATDHKLLAPLHGRPVIAHALAAVLGTDLDTYVVWGAVSIDDAVAAVDGGERVRLVHNPDWERGQATSVHTAIAALDAGSEEHDAIVVGLGDQPFVTTDAWDAVASSPSPIAVATYDGRRGHPVRLHRSVWSMLPVDGDVVGRSAMRNRPDLVAEIACTGDPSDIDTLEDLRRWS